VKKIEKLRKSTRPEFPNDTLVPSWDVLQQITKNLRKFPEESSLRWIPSHQDDKTPIEQLPPDARLNVRADRLAGQFQQQSPHHQHDWELPMIDGARCHLVINNCVIGSKHKRMACNVLQEKAIFRYMQTKYKWTDTTTQGIDWAGHKQAVSSWTYAHRKERMTKSTNVSTQVPAQMACNRKNGGKIQCHTVPQGIPILPTPSRGSNPFSKMQCQI
jgi:hypothetical protein